MFFRVRRAAHRAWFDRQCRSLLRTLPLISNDPGLTLVSMVCHGECMMYLLAVKSFCRQLGRIPQIVVLNDGSLSPPDTSTIHAHLPSAIIVDIATIGTGTCPRGSCWERLMLIADLVQNTFVVQLDCDTLTLAPIPEVEACLTAGQSFTLLGDRSYPIIEPILDSWNRLKTASSTQVQAVCERTFNLLPESSHLKYLRGNAGFTGFARGSIDREKITWFSDRMRQLAGQQWEQWGSEQLTSNLLIANSPGAQPLPSPKYVSFWDHPDVPYEEAAFIHFIGPHRFAKGFYLRRAKAVISTLA